MYDSRPGEIRVSLDHDAESATLRIADNGIGLPKDRAKLFEPYVTTREKGTGLGLPIVRKIIEEHDGKLTLEDAPPFGPDAPLGAEAVITLPITAATTQEPPKPAKITA